MTAIRVEVTAEDLAVYDDPERPETWARPMEAAISALAGQGVDIDGSNEEPPGFAYVASIGGRDSGTTLVVDLPPEAGAWLDRRFDGDRCEPIAFDLIIDDWLVAFVGRAS
jgi:hypothetical protein